MFLAELKVVYRYGSGRFSPTDIEDRLVCNPADEECFSVGIQDGIHGQEVGCFVKETRSSRDCCRTSSEAGKGQDSMTCFLDW